MDNDAPSVDYQELASNLGRTLAKQEFRRILLRLTVIMEANHSTPPGPQKDWVYFLDFDGTLVDIAERPEGVRVKRELVILLTALARATGEAVVLVSGRPISSLDFHLQPLRLRAAGLHGLECRRERDGVVEGSGLSVAELDPIRPLLTDFAADNEGVEIEDKGVAIAVHYRRAPEREAQARQVARTACHDLGPAFTCLPGKMVYEIKPRSAHKGDVIDKFMAIGAFSGRRPVFVGDDVTDEDGFRACNARGGVSVRVGPTNGPTDATFRLSDVQEVEAWLGCLVEAEIGSTS